MFGLGVKLERVIEESYRNEKKRDKTTKNNIKRKAGKALAGFFAVIILLTVIARAADSMTVAKVKTTKVTSSSLLYKTLGTGSIVAGSKKYIYLNSGIRVEKIMVKKGQKVKANDEILKINLDDTKKKLKEANTELKKLELAYEEKQLDTSGNTNNEVEFAKQDLEMAQQKYKEAEAAYKNSVVKHGENVLQTKTDAYEKAKYDYEQEKLAYDDSIKKENRTIDDSKKKLEDSKETLANLDKCINKYADSVIAQDYTGRKDALNKIYIIAYGGKEEYEKYLEDLADAQSQKNIADASYENSRLEWKASCDKANEAIQQEKTKLDAIKKSDYKTVEEYNTAYNNQLAIYNTAKTEYDKVYNSLSNSSLSASASVSSTSTTLSKLKKKTDSISKILDEYVSSKKNKDTALIALKLEEADKIVLGESSYKTLINQTSDNGKTLERQNTDYELHKRKLDMSLSMEKETMDKAKKVLDSVKNGTYDYETELESYKQAMNTAKDSISTSDRALERAKLGQEKSSLFMEAAKIDMDVKREEIGKLESIVKSDGVVRAETAGIIEKIEAEEGKVTASDNPVVTLSTGGFSFEGTMPKKEAERIKVKDSCNIKLTDSKDSIEATVEFIENTADETKITATLPKGDYVVGTNGEFSAEKSSEIFDNCISLGAIRYDNQAKYILVLSEKDSILGKETTVRRIDITIVDKDSKNAVIKGGLSTKDIVVSESSKAIKEGDRVRVVEQEGKV